MEDLFEKLEELPCEVKAILYSLDENENLYYEAERVLLLLAPLGYTFDYDLNGELYNLRTTKIKKEQ